MHDLLGDHAPYLDADVKADSPLLHHLGVQSTVSVPAALHALQQWSRQPGFETDLRHMTRVYEFLSWKMTTGSAADAAAVCRAFSDNKLIWLPGKEQQPASNPLAPVTAGLQLAPHAFSATSALSPGKFYGAGEALCYWDPAGVIEGADSSAMRSLYSHYPSERLCSFFCQQLLHYDSGSGCYRQGSGLYPAQQGPELIVSACATTADYLGLLKCLATQEGSDLAFQQAGQLLAYWSACFNSNQLQDAHLIPQEMKQHCLLPAVDDEWVALCEAVYLMDDEASAQHFEDEPMSFLAFPQPPVAHGVG